MKVERNFLKNVLMLTAVLILTSCVGTVKDSNPKTSDILNTGAKAPAISFDGLIKATPISHDKVELQFRGADGADEIIYEIYVNNSPIPIKLNSRSLVLKSNGNYFFTITALQTNSTYSFNMRATPAGFASDSKLDPNKSLSATTFNNQTADFLGIASVALAAGEAGRDSVVVKWNPATITGTTINLKDSDPVQYQITYISQLGGPANLNNPSYNGPDRFTIYSPALLTSPPALNKDKEYPVSGLTPGSTYYFQVRAVHKGYVTHGSDPLYKKEENTRYAKITTLAFAGVFDFNNTQVLATHPLGEKGLTNLDISWLPAMGEFNHYRVCYKKIAAPNTIPTTNDLLQDNDIDLILNNPGFCIQQAANLTSYRLTGLEPYAYYQVKVLACRTALCTSTDRIKSSLMQERVIANIAQFSGILKAANPVSDTNLDEITISFDPPITSSGYVSKMRLYCYSNLSDPSPVILPTDTTVSSGTGKALCDGISTTAEFPTTFDAFGSFTEATLKFATPIDGSRTYCLSLVPSIESPYLEQVNLAGAVIKCFTPELKTPNIVQFQGKNPTCDVSSGQNVGISWSPPTGGIYSKYVIFYKQKNLSSDFFNFAEATAAYIAGNAASPYKWMDNIDSTAVSETLLNLTPGKIYSIGILPYLNSGGQKFFGQYNLGVDDCMLPLPKATFNEWVDIFAIGPKEDGLTPITFTTQRKFILETLDEDGIPVELKIQTDEKSPDTGDPLAAIRTSSSYLDGVYGAKEGKDINPLNQYSNSGIVKIAWKDVSFFNDTTKMSNFISSLESTPGQKNTRKYGYRVYRSEDNQMSWVDLTSQSTKNKFQSIYNSGPIHSKSYSWKKRNNDSSITEQIVFFTDYSVKFSGSNGEVDRARTYWYKIIPVFDGKELVYDPDSNQKHHIIRVTLPPRNMALVHRMMANRTICLEMDKTLNKNEGDHYSCKYNGLGSSGVNNVPTVGNTVYDAGGDLLIDRFELSCPYTRGDPNYTNSDSDFGGSKISFNGRSSYGNSFKGCFNDQSNTYEPALGAYTPSENYLYNQVIPGDCFGRESGTITATGTTACINPAKTKTSLYIYPGALSEDLSLECTNPAKLGANIANLGDPLSKINTDNTYHFPTQSEFSAVYYMRGNFSSDWYTHTSYNYAGGNGKKLNYSNNAIPSNCTVNLPYVNVSGHYAPRWIAVNALFDKLTPTGGTRLSIATKTISQVLADPDLYDQDSSGAVQAPPADLLTNNRYSSSTSLMRVFTSNAAKLPGITGLNQLDYNKVCNSYKVEVGIETSLKGFIGLDSVKEKRLMRKKESVVASAWPPHFDNSTVTNLETGTFIENTNYKGCNSVTRINAPGNSPLYGNLTYSKGSKLTPLFPTAGKLHSSVVEGSSALDGANSSTEKCVSRFGVQDIVGNLREINGDEIFCDYTQDKLFLGVQNSLSNSVDYTEGTYFDPLNMTPWVLPTPDSGSCSVVEKGAYRAGTYTSGGSFNSIFDYSGVNTQVVSTPKRFDQEAVLASRNGDGSFLDFGQNSFGPKLDKDNTLSLTDTLSASNYFSPVLGLPLTCAAGCDGDGDDNTLITAEKIAAAKGYTTSNNPLGISLLNFPTNNSVITNLGISEIASHDPIDTSFPGETAVNYISSINLGADSIDPNDNFGVLKTLVPGSSDPASLETYIFPVGRGSVLKMYTGGSATSAAGRYSLYISGNSDEAERYPNYDLSSRCVLMINQE